MQLFRCGSCSRKFSNRPASHTTYPLHAIIETLSLYDRGYTLEESARRAGKRHRLTITKQLAASWKARYASFFPYFRIRDAVVVAHPPHTLILSARLHHGQVYEFSYHRGKTEHLLREGNATAFRVRSPQGRTLSRGTSPTSLEALQLYLEADRYPTRPLPRPGEARVADQAALQSHEGRDHRAQERRGRDGELRHPDRLAQHQAP